MNVFFDRSKNNQITLHIFRLVLVVCMFVCVALPALAAAPVRFVQISDVHFNPSRNYAKGRMVKYSGDLLKDAVAQVNALQNIDFVVFTGDIIDNPSEKLIRDFAAIANTLDVPWYWTQGNHDVGPKALSRAQFRTIMNKHNRYEQPQAGYYAFQARGFMFVLLDGAQDDKVTSQGYFPRETLTFLSRVLQENAAMPAVIFQHFPVVYPIASKSHEVTNQAEYLAAIDAHPNVKAVFASHFHIAKFKRRNNVAHIAAPALVQYPNAFRVVTLENTGAGVSLRASVVETRLKDVQKKSLQGSPGAGAAKGSDSDRTIDIVIK